MIQKIFVMNLYMVWNMCDICIVSTQMTNTIATNAISTVSINCHNKKVRYKIDCYILQAVSLVVILLLMITNIR